jgi:23S rRNA A2030 N6-methylase RlmJ
MSALDLPHSAARDYRDLALRIDHDRAELLQAMQVLAQPIQARDVGRMLLQQMQRVVPRAVLLIGAAVLVVLASRRLRLSGWLTLGMEVWRAWPTARRLLAEVIH